MQDAVNGYRAVGDRSADMATLLNDLADALAQSGRDSESGPLLKEAESLTGDLKNESLKAQLLTTQADVQRYRGDTQSADVLYQQALRSALRGSAPEEVLISRLHAAEIGLGRANSVPLAQEFRKLIQEADRRNLKYLSLQSSVDEAEALIGRKDFTGAQRELQTALGTSEKMGARYESARIHYLLATSLRLGGSQSEASEHYRLALNLLEDMRKDAGAEKLLDRSDLKAMFTEASKFASATN
jgi:tetratricopeptide (TPR) repeat protein